jgi:hypothetical protein
MADLDLTIPPRPSSEPARGVRLSPATFGRRGVPIVLWAREPEVVDGSPPTDTILASPAPGYRESAISSSPAPEVYQVFYEGKAARASAAKPSGGGVREERV